MMPHDELLLAEMRERLQSDRDRGRGLGAAIWHVTLGEPAQGITALRRWLDALNESSVEAVFGAVLAADWDGASREAREILGKPTDTYVPGYRSYLRATLALIAADRSKAEAFLKETEEYARAHSNIGTHPLGALDILRGLLNNSPERIAGGLEALLDTHLRRARQSSDIFNSPTAIVSLEAMCILLLAHRMGMSVTVADRYRAASIPLLVICLKEFQGKPLASTTKLEGTFDLIGGPWLRELGLNVPDPPKAVARRASPSRGKHRAEVDEETARQSLRMSEAGDGYSLWVRSGWALALGEQARARQHLARAAAEAEAAWKQRRLPSGEINENYVMDHFRLALLVGEGVETPLRLLEESEHAMKAKGLDIKMFLHSATGHLVVLKKVLQREFKETAGLRDLALDALYRVALVGLVENDSKGLSEGFNEMLEEHARHLDRFRGMFDPVCRAAAEIAAVATMGGIPFEVDPSFRDYPAPFKVFNVPEHKGKVGVIRCDLLGHGLWSRRPA
jgi:hypothetical protein